MECSDFEVKDFEGEPSILRFRAIFGSKPKQFESYEICLSKTTPGVIDNLELQCQGAGPIGGPQGGVKDNFGSSAKSDLLFVDLNLKKEKEEKRISNGDIL